MNFNSSFVLLVIRSFCFLLGRGLIFLIPVLSVMHLLSGVISCSFIWEVEGCFKLSWRGVIPSFRWFFLRLYLSREAGLVIIRLNKRFYIAKTRMLVCLDVSVNNKFSSVTLCSSKAWKRSIGCCQCLSQSNCNYNCESPFKIVELPEPSWRSESSVSLIKVSKLVFRVTWLAMQGWSLYWRYAAAMRRAIRIIASLDMPAPRLS